MSRETRDLVTKLRKNPHDLDLLRAVQHAMEMGQREAELAHLLEWWAGYAPDDPMASKALMDAARYLEKRPEKRAHALSLLTHALVRDPSNEQASYRLRQLLEEAENHVELEKVLADWSLSVRREGAPATLCALASFTLAHVRSLHLDDVDGAIAALEDTLRAFGEHPDAKKMLAELYARRARITLRKPERGREDCHRAAQLFFELGQFELGDQAIAYLLRALDLVPHHSGAMEALLRRVGVKNLELVRKRLTGYVALSPDRVRTHRFRFELVRTLFRERRYGEAVPHLQHLANRGYAEARRVLERLCPELVHPDESPELSAPPAYDKEHTTMETRRLSREDARPTLPPPALVRAAQKALAAQDDEVRDLLHTGDLNTADLLYTAEEDPETTVLPSSGERLAPGPQDDIPTATHEFISPFATPEEEGITVEYHPRGRSLEEIEDDATREYGEEVQRLSSAPNSEPLILLSPKSKTEDMLVTRKPSLLRAEHTLGLALVTLTSAVALTSYLLGIGH